MVTGKFLGNKDLGVASVAGLVAEAWMFAAHWRRLNIATPILSSWEGFTILEGTAMGFGMRELDGANCFLLDSEEMRVSFPMGERTLEPSVFVGFCPVEVGETLSEVGVVTIDMGCFNFAMRCTLRNAGLRSA